MNPDKVIDSKDLKFSEKSVIYDAKRNALRILSRAEDQLEFGSFEVGVWAVCLLPALVAAAAPAAPRPRFLPGANGKSGPGAREYTVEKLEQ